MASSAHRALTALAVVACLVPAFMTTACHAPSHAARTPHVIVIPGKDSVSSTISPAGLDWLSHFGGSESGTAGR